MIQTVADYIADFLVEKQITDVFSVVGGGAMFLNDAFGKKQGLHCTYNHHEQACAMAAEGYYKYKGNMAAVCVTTGPGGTNAITGVLGAWQDSIPLFVISGQVRYETTVESTGLPLRQYGGQEHQIIDTVRNITKYAVMIKKPEDIRYYLEKAYDVALAGRRGPVWLDIPLNVQSTYVDTEKLKGYEVQQEQRDMRQLALTIIQEMQNARRPLIVAGSAIRTAGKVEEFLQLVEKWDMPVTYPLVVPDIISAENEHALGCFGSVASRAANIAVQNADLLVVFGCRMTFTHIGFNYQKFSPQSRKIVIDIDVAEQEKPIMKRDVKIIADVGAVIDELLRYDAPSQSMDMLWNSYCRDLKRHFPVFQSHHCKSAENKVNMYYMAKCLTDRLDKDSIVVLGNSSGLDPKLQMGIREQGERVILNCNCGSMGYCLPAGIGAAIASGKRVVVYTGDGCIQMNIQELETIEYHRLPIKIIILNNGGYGGIVATQNNFCEGRLTGCTKQSGLGMPDFEKLAYAYNLDYMRIDTHKDVHKSLELLFSNDRPAICEVQQDTIQQVEPCVSSRRRADGTLVSTAIDDMYPFLTVEEYQQHQYASWKKTKEREQNVE